MENNKSSILPLCKNTTRTQTPGMLVLAITFFVLSASPAHAGDNWPYCCTDTGGHPACGDLNYGNKPANATSQPAVRCDDGGPLTNGDGSACDPNSISCMEVTPWECDAGYHQVGNNCVADVASPTGSISQVIGNPKTSGTPVYSSNPTVTLGMQGVWATEFTLNETGANFGPWLVFPSGAPSTYTYGSTDSCNKKVYVKYRNEGGTSPVYSSNDFCLDRGLPNVSIAVSTTQVSVNCADPILNNADAGSGCDSTSFKLSTVASTATLCPSQASSYALNSPQPVPSSSTKYCAMAMDKVGNTGFTSSPVVAGGSSTCTLRGDVDCNNVVNQEDLALVRRYIVNQPLGLPLLTSSAVNWNNGDSTACSSSNAGNIDTRDVAFYHAFLQSGNWPTCANES